MGFPTTPGAIIGYTSRGPIRLIAGGSGEGDTPADPPATDTPAGGDDAEGAELLDQALKTPDDDAGDAGGYDERTKRTIAAVRDDFKAEREKRQAAEARATEVEQKQKKTLDDLARALGLKTDEDDKPDPEALTQQLTEREQELRTLRVERAAERSARTNGADVDALLDSRAFTNALAKLDPAAETFAADVDALVAGTVEKNPKYKAAGQVPAASSADFSGGPGAATRERPKSIIDALNNSFS